jgi:CheY-like chemotaxis protein
MARIVLAEDEPDIRMVAARILRNAGHTVTEAPDGAAALEAVLADSTHIVISDIDMPVMTGIQLCQALRAHAETRNVPVVLVSGSLVPGDPRAAAAQATAILLKPFRRVDLLTCVEQTLRTGHGDGGSPVMCL